MPNDRIVLGTMPTSGAYGLVVSKAGQDADSILVRENILFSTLGSSLACAQLLHYIKFSVSAGSITTKDVSNYGKKLFGVLGAIYFGEVGFLSGKPKVATGEPADTFTLSVTPHSTNPTTTSTITLTATGLQGGDCAVAIFAEDL